MRRTPNDLIHIGNPIPFNVDLFLTQLKDLMDAAYENREDCIRDMVRDIVDTYHPAGEHGSEFKGTAYKQLIREMEIARKNQDSSEVK